MALKDINLIGSGVDLNVALNPAKCERIKEKRAPEHRMLEIDRATQAFVEELHDIDIDLCGFLIKIKSSNGVQYSYAEQKKREK